MACGERKGSLKSHAKNDCDPLFRRFPEINWLEAIKVFSSLHQHRLTCKIKIFSTIVSTVFPDPLLLLKSMYYSPGGKGNIDIKTVATCHSNDQNEAQNLSS